MKNIVRYLCFIAIGISAFSNPMEPMNFYNFLFGAVAGLLFGWLFRIFLRAFLGLFNGKLKQEKGKKIIKFVPASGAASRMFKDLFEFIDAPYDVPTKPFEKTFF